ncbi:18.1 kDa class I heat shock protein-like [Wolffia australiana]
MASLIPWGGGGGGRRRSLDPFVSDVWDPYGRGSEWLTDTWRGGDDTIANTFVDWRETADAHIFRADIPGVKREEVKVHVEDGNVLEISGERSKEEERGTATWHRVERRRGKFRRRFRLPEDADMDAVRSTLERGVLTVTVPKRAGMEGRRPSVRPIDIF